MGGEYLSGLLNLAVFDAGSAYADVLIRAVHHSANLLQIDVPAALGYIVRVAHLISEPRAAPANITRLRHCLKHSWEDFQPLV